MKYADAPYIRVSPFSLYGLKSNFRRILTKEYFIPVEKYRRGWRPVVDEVGVLAVRVRGRDSIVRKILCL